MTSGTESKQQQMERILREEPQHAKRQEALRWLTAPATEVPERERIPIDVLLECAYNDSSGIWATDESKNLRVSTIRAMGRAAIDNEPEREALLQALESLTTDRTIMPRDKEVAREVLAETKAAMGRS